MSRLFQSMLALSIMAYVVLVPGTLFGQIDNESDPRITVSALGGVSIATWAGEGLGNDNPGSRIGLTNVNLSATLPIADKFGVQLNGTYANKGASFDVGLGPVGGNVKLDYIEMSAFGKVSSTTLGRGTSSIYALAGPTIGFKARCKVGLSLGGLDAIVEGGEEADCGDDYKSTDLGVTGGIGIDWQVQESTGLRSTLEIRYTHGLISIPSEEAAGSIKSRTYTIWVGATIPVGM